MGSVEQSTGGGGDLNSRGSGRGGKRGRGGGEVNRGRSRGYARPGDQYEKRSYNRNHGQQPNHNESNKNKDRPSSTTIADSYQNFTSPELEFDDEQLAIHEQIQLMNLQKESSGKKISLNHLLRFTLPQREAPQPVRRTRKTAGTPFKKETFLHANYRFIVSGEGGDYSDNISDPDRTVQWEYVEQVYFHTDLEEEYHCPICLDKPVAAKVSRCGHVFCWACIMHHLSYTKGAGQCPLCFDWMLLKDLKSVVIEVTPKFSLNDDISFSLLQRNAEVNIPRLKTTPAQDAALGIPDVGHRLPVYTDAGSEFCRLAIAYDITAILAREWSELSEAARLASSAQDDSLPYITHAQEALRERADKAHIPFAAISNRPSRSRHRHNNVNTSGARNINTSQNAEEHSTQNANHEPNNNVNSQATNISTIPTTTTSTPSATSLTQTPTPAPPVINTTTPTPTPTPTPAPSTEQTNPDMWGWGEDEETSSSSTSTSSSTATTPSKPIPTPSSTSPAPSSTSPTVPQQVTFLHSSYDQTHIPPSVLESQSTTPPSQAEDTSSPPSTQAHAHENFAQETPHGLYYFYQVQDGQTVFLHPFCVRVLAHEHRAFDRLPLALRATVLDLEEVVQTEKTRRKFQHLSHLPITCKFLLVYIDLAPLVSARTLNYFAEDLKKIKQNREKRLKLEKQKLLEKEREEREDRNRVQERARERQAEMALMRQSFTPLSATSPPFIPSSSSTTPPSQIPPEFATSPPSGTESEEKEEEERREDEDEDEGISFAQALMGAKPKPKRRPKPKQNINNNNNTSNPENASSGGGGRRKKKQTVLLFSNSGSRGHF